MRRAAATAGTSRAATNISQDGEQRKAEILSIQTRQGKPKFYVHYEEFNKRLDEWVAAERINLSREVEWPAPEKPDKKKAAASKTDKAPSKSDQKNLKRSRSKLDREISGTPESTSSNQKQAARRIRNC
jgi:histone acetyltransferase HTATIP